MPQEAVKIREIKMAHKVLYRIYRPRTFDDVYGQRHITDILKRQIETGNIAHAYLFSGPRGTGKTSTAKIFAAALNCLNSSDGNPCLECENCREAVEDRYVDIIEMDAASNNGVDNIRDIREKVALLPSKGRYKVYIIDEVHMLSAGAFNALLKTLEEPPAHAVFILATTELRKVPATIMSRCQQYEFRRIEDDEIVKRLTYIADESSIEYEPEALGMIASYSDGAMRDAVSMLDMCSAYGNVTADVVHQALGVSGRESIGRLCDDITEGKVKEALNDLKEVISEGSQTDIVMKEIICALTDKLEQAAGSDDTGRILYSLDVMIKASSMFRYSAAPKEHLTAAVARACMPECSDDPADLKLRVETLEMQNQRMITRINELQNYIKNSGVPEKKTAVPSAASEKKNEEKKPLSASDREARLIDALHRK